MKALLTLVLPLVLLFASTFVIIKSTGLLTIEQIRLWLEAAQHANPLYVSSMVVALLFADLFIAVPTLTIIILSGYFLGPLAGALSAIIGLSLAGMGGYGISYRYGDKLIRKLQKDASKHQQAVHTFARHGPILILLARALPILPEVTSCLAGISRMRFAKFMLLWLCSSVPYAMIGAYAGAISSIENPKPAIFTAIGMSTLLWLGWLVAKRRISPAPSKL
ncbi:VTT domain-containing protein [Bowmanella sp. Y26]|uniref:TVP38/TMEM64 family protein n=1 Tax=Bowmanella yangjiangensis TaxID=2811230 RepID=UPI001BDDA7A2|nr:VTT domain-containing protein [Bowmanella yangjiangensis]MBT1063212.1 VTT domain-containing protein [Bowmanella yangjiangensis]